MYPAPLLKNVSGPFITAFSLCNSFGEPLKGVTPDNCATWFDFKLANTGDNPQPLVAFSVPAGTASLSDVHILHLVASNGKIPKIVVQTTDLPGEYRIRELPPNVLVTVRLSTSGVEKARRLKEGQGVVVRANGRTINVDPHAAVIIRMLYAFFTVLGF